jgi:hypothetical protein
MAGSKDRDDAGKKGTSRSPVRAASRPPADTSASRERGRTIARRGGNDIVVHERVVQPVGGGGNIVYPTLTATNYIEWALVMKINLRAQGLWEAVSGMGEPGEREDMAALAALIRAAPPEMVPVLAVKESANEAWEAIKMMRMGVDRVREATAQRLRREFEQISFRSGESLDSFGMRITGIVNNLRTLGDDVQEVRVVQKILREVPSDYKQIVVSIETMLDITKMPVEELIGRLRSAMERCGNDTSNAAGGQVLLTEEEWIARSKRREHGQGSGSNGGGKGKNRGKQNVKGGGERDMSHVKCYNCNKYAGHFSRDCKEPRRERKGRVNLAQSEEKEEETLLMARSGEITLAHQEATHVGHVLLNEKRSKATATTQAGRCDTAWFLDSGASNHMCGRREFFSELDTSVHGFVKLGDDSSV